MSYLYYGKSFLFQIPTPKLAGNCWDSTMALEISSGILKMIILDTYRYLLIRLIRRMDSLVISHIPLAFSNETVSV